MGEKSNNDAKPLASLPPIVTAIVDFFFTGLGAVLMGQMKKGIVWFIVVVVCYVCSWITLSISFWIAIVLKVLFAVESFKLASKQANGSPIKEGEYVFKIFALPLGLLGVEAVKME